MNDLVNKVVMQQNFQSHIDTFTELFLKPNILIGELIVITNPFN